MRVSTVKKNIWRVCLESYDSKLLDVVVKKICTIAQTNLIKLSVVALPSKNKLFTVLRSPFIYKTARDQYYLCSKKRVIFLHLQLGQTIDLFRDISIPSGVGINVKPTSE